VERTIAEDSLLCKVNQFLSIYLENELLWLRSTLVSKLLPPPSSELFWHKEVPFNSYLAFQEIRQNCFGFMVEGTFEEAKVWTTCCLVLCQTLIFCDEVCLVAFFCWLFLEERLELLVVLELRLKFIDCSRNLKLKKDWLQRILIVRS